MILSKWYRSKRIPFLVFIFLTCSLFYMGRNISLGNNVNLKKNTCCIEISYPGMNSKFLEDEIAVPLENHLSKIAGLCEISSICDENKISMVLEFDESVDKRNLYFEISRELDLFRKSISYPIQIPRIYFDGNETSPDFVACIFNDSKNNSQEHIIVKELVPLLEGFKEVSRVRILGRGEKDFSIKFDGKELLRRGISPREIAGLIQLQTLPDKSICYDLDLRSETLNFKTKLKTLDDLKELKLKTNNQYIRLSDFCNLTFEEKEKDEIVRLNGLECMEIEVCGKSDSSIFKLSKKCNETLRNHFQQKEYIVLYDAAKEQGKGIKHILFSLLQSLVLISILIPLILRNKNLTLTVISFLPVAILWNLLLLSSLGVVINREIIAGICISLGIIIDPLLVIADLRLDFKENETFLKEMKNTIPALFSSSGTNIIIFIPFFFLDKIIPGISVVCFSIVVMISVSFILAVFFYPNLFYAIEIKCNLKNRKKEIKILKLKFSRQKVAAVYILLISISVFAFVFFKRDFTWNTESNIISVNIEYNPEKKKEKIDESICKLVDFINNNFKIEKMISISRKGNGELKIFYDKKKTSKTDLKDIIDGIKCRTEDGIPFTDDGIYRKNPGFDIEVSIEGFDSSVCRSLAKKIAETINLHSNETKTVLNFKELEKNITLIPYYQEFARHNSTPFEIAESLYWYLESPVVSKWIQNKKEYDIKLYDEQNKTFSPENLYGKKILIEDESINVSQLFKFENKTDVERRYRKNNKPCAKLTVHFSEFSMEDAEALIVKSIKEVGLPENYSFSFDRKTKEYQDNIKDITISLLLAIILLYVFICIFNENPKSSVLILSIIPAAFSFPLFIKLIFNSCFGPEDFIGMAVAAGLVVNNAILIESSGLYRNRKSIFLTNLTTIIGSIPMLLSISSGIEKELAFYMLFSSAGALFLSFMIFPRLIMPDNISFCKYSLQVQ